MKRAFVCALLLCACAEMGAELDAPGGEPPDVGAGSDAGAGADAPAPDRAGPLLFADPNDPANAPSDEAGQCVESMADAFGAPLGCEESNCRQASQACCVGRADCCSNQTQTLALSFDSCGEDCVPGQGFGAPLPNYIGGFAPGGDADFDSGLVLDERVDLRGELVTLSADFQVPTFTCTRSDCFQSVGVSVSRNAPSGATTHVSSIAGLLWTGARMHLIIGERSIKDWGATTNGTWSIDINADGNVRVYSSASDDGAIDETFSATILPSEAHVVLHGHNVNPGGGGEDSARVTSFELSRRQCEMTRQWSERSAVEQGSGLTNTIRGASSPTSVRDADGRLRIAYLREGRVITTFRGDDDTPDIWVGADEAYDALERSEGMEVAAPELAFEDGKLLLFYESGGEIYRSEETEDDGGRLSFGSGVSIDAIEVDEGTVHAPTYASRGASRDAALIVRAEWNDGRRASLMAFSLASDGTVVLHDRLPTDSLGEELGDPELFIRNRLYQLYVPYRRGTRWRLAHLTSADFVFWNIADEVALEAGGREEVFGPRAPDTDVVEDGVEVFYERFDGSEQTLGRVFRRTPALASLP